MVVDTIQVVLSCLPVSSDPAFEIQSNLDISKLMGLFFTSSNAKCKLICTSGNLDLYKSLQHQVMVGESDQNVFLIQIDASISQNSKYPSSRYRESTVVILVNLFTHSPPNKLSSAIFLVCFNFQGNSMLLAVGVNVNTFW